MPTGPIHIIFASLLLLNVVMTKATEQLWKIPCGNQGGIVKKFNDDAYQCKQGLLLFIRNGHLESNTSGTLIERIDDACDPASVRAFTPPQPPAEEGAHVLVLCTDGTGRDVPLEMHDIVVAPGI